MYKIASIKDETKFGQKLMEKMGWEQGKGLGAKETGITENLKVKFKGDSKGIGYNNNDYDNVWLDHQDDYEKLLSDLGKSNDQNMKTCNTSEQVQTLELNSKSSKARLHYKKFTKSKDLTNASLNDLNCILGKEKRTKLAASQQMLPVIEKTDQVVKKEVDETNGGLFSTNTLSVSDYFAKKMAARLNKTSPNEEVATENLLEDEDVSETNESSHKVKRKKSKKEKNPIEIEIDQQHEEQKEVVIEEEEEPVEKVKRKKSKKSKKDNFSEENTAKNSETEVVNTVAEVEETLITSTSTKSFNGSSLFNIYGYSAYNITADFKEVLNYKIKKSQKKKEWTERILNNDPKYYEMNKKKCC